MDTLIRIGIAGYGNLGRGVEAAISRNHDMTLTGIFTRRDPASVRPLAADAPVHRLAELDGFADRIDVLIVCGGSKSDLPELGPQLAARFHTVDSFDTHARIPWYFDAMDAAARPNGKIAIIAVGWDPGLFSLARLYGEAALPGGSTWTFWGRGLSQGHSDAIRRVPGVRAAVQYTIPVAEAVERVRRGEDPVLSTREKHTRECWVVLEDGADAQAVEQAIRTMPDYFADYDTTVNFIDEATLRRDHSQMPHGGFVIRTGETGLDNPAVTRSGKRNRHTMEFSLTLGSNPEFTASVLVAHARAAARLARRGESGARTTFDIAPGLLSPRSAAQLRAEWL